MVYFVFLNTDEEDACPTEEDSSLVEAWNQYWEQNWKTVVYSSWIEKYFSQIDLEPLKDFLTKDGVQIPWEKYEKLAAEVRRGTEKERGEIEEKEKRNGRNESDDKAGATDSGFDEAEESRKGEERGGKTFGRNGKPRGKSRKDARSKGLQRGGRGGRVKLEEKKRR